MNRRQLLGVAAGSLMLKAQTPQEFEVASIKPSAPMAMGRMRVGVEMMPGGRVSMTGVTARFLIQQAYGVRDFQIVGGPDWMKSDRYDITAKPEEAASGDQVKEMMKSLLKDRFKLEFHRETKELPTYALVVAKGGARLKKSEMQDGGGDGPGRGGAGRGGMMRMGRGQINAQGIEMAGLVNQLSQQLGRSVIDKTELTGDYDIKLEWTPDANEGGAFRGAEVHEEARPEGPSLYTALQEQLGLKLESSKGMVEILTVDKAEKPTGN
jgi:uncharacterized protein (TIGR03435 family)